MAQEIDAKKCPVRRWQAIIRSMACNRFGDGHVDRLPYSLKILLENLLRHADGEDVTEDDIMRSRTGIRRRSRVTKFPLRRRGSFCRILRAFPRSSISPRCAMPSSSSAVRPTRSTPFRRPNSSSIIPYKSIPMARVRRSPKNTAIEFDRNKERYSFLRWGQNAFRNFRVVPPNTGIVHQVNLEYLARVIFDNEKDGQTVAYPDTVVGTDSHTTMINGLGVLGWGVGGIEAEAAMLGQPITMLIPQVIGFRLTGRLREGTTATDLVLTVTSMLRDKGVVGKFVEFFGDGLSGLPLADRATLSNMAPEFGSTCATFPIDQETITYLELSGRDPAKIALVEAYAKAQGIWRIDGQPDPLYTDILELDLGSVEPSISGPSRPHDLILLSNAASTYEVASKEATANRGQGEVRSVSVQRNGETFDVSDGAVLIAAITSCTNTSNPSVMIAAGLLARNARQKGLKAQPWVKTSLGPGSRVVSNYLEQSGLQDDLDAIGFDIVGFGCTTCIGNSGPLDESIAEAVRENDLVGCSVLSGNRNFEGRIHPLVRMNFLASPPLVVAYALAGSMEIDISKDALGQDSNGDPVLLKDIWPSQAEIQEIILANIDSEMFRQSYASVFAGDANWNGLDVPTAQIYEWAPDSTYVRNPPYFDGMSLQPDSVDDIRGARVLAMLGDNVTTDHISPAGSFAPDSPAGKYLIEQGVDPKDFNSYGSRRGNHEVMMRGTFANIRLRNQLAPGTEGGWTTYQPGGEQVAIYDASVRYAAEKVPLIVIAGKEYGMGSSRDWAAKGTKLLGVAAVLAESFERIHRSNLIGMGVLPLQFRDGESAGALGITGTEVFDITGLDAGNASEVTVVAHRDDGASIEFRARVCIDTPKERDYFRNGGILHYVLRQLAA